MYRPKMATEAPSPESIKAIDFPRPVPPPVINAVLPTNVPAGSIGFFFTGKCLACGLVFSAIVNYSIFAVNGMRRKTEVE